MEIVCKSCGLRYEAGKSSRCPRCNTINNRMMKCEDCKGCGVFGIRKKIKCGDD